MLGVLGSVCCCDFLVSLSEEHGFRKWKRFGLKPNREKQKLGLFRGAATEADGEVEEERLTHGGLGGAVLVKAMEGILWEGGGKW